MDWIPFSYTNDLPKEGQSVYITFINSSGRHTGEAEFKQGAFWYIAETDDGDYEEQYGIVVAWSKLPEPYIEDK